MLMPMTAEDVVTGIFYHLKQHDKIKLTADREALHRAFFAAKTKYPAILSVFTFRDREQFPESNQLDQALSNLDAAGLISRQNLTPRYYLFETPLVSSYDRFSRRILTEAGIREEDIEAVAREIETLAFGNA